MNAVSAGNCLRKLSGGSWDDRIDASSVSKKLLGKHCSSFPTFLFALNDRAKSNADLKSKGQHYHHYAKSPAPPAARGKKRPGLWQ